MSRELALTPPPHRVHSLSEDSLHLAVCVVIPDDLHPRAVLFDAGALFAHSNGCKSTGSSIRSIAI